MKKKILGLALAAFMFGFVGANAQTENTNCNKTEQTCKQECKKDKGDKKECKKDKARKKSKMNPMNGIDLTPQQEQQIEQLKAEQQAQREKDKQYTREAVEKRREAYNAGLEKILTPEQYQQYQSNLDGMKKMSKEKKEKMKSKKAERLDDAKKEAKM